MKPNLRGKIREFVQSEEGKVGVKSPLTLGAAVGSVLLAQAIIGTPEAEAKPCWAIAPFSATQRAGEPSYEGSIWSAETIPSLMNTSM